jgi:flagellar assembly protein FliH
MADEARGASTSLKKSAVLSDGSYVIEPRVRFLRPPTGMKLEPVTSMPEPPPEVVEEETKAVEEAGPSPEDLARQEAALILENARREAEEVRQQAREQGYADGLKEGVEQGKNEGREEGLGELKGALDRWMTMGDALSEAWRLRFEGLEEEIKDLAVTTAEKLVQSHLAASPEAILGVVRDALRHAAEAELVTVLLNSKDVAIVRGAREELAALLRGTGRFEIMESDKVEPGSCVVETKTQVIDASRKTRLGNLRDSMRSGGAGGIDA